MNKLTDALQHLEQRQAVAPRIPKFDDTYVAKQFFDELENSPEFISLTNTNKEFFLLSCAANQDLESYYRKKIALGAKLGLPTSTVIDAPTDGLLLQERNLMKVYRPVDTPEWLEMVRQIRWPEENAAGKRHYHSLHSAASLRPQRLAFTQRSFQ
ncbi:hypothetical protein LAZ67_13000576 [Cordylochernes scorpioides]|uniref:Uncharacterized protein n=1 Tax=Cordylochernes scorpioides TaxID=51811 RepID=A0ABY6L3J1_9ARAC|nr:hypothetical protein LAZ67_13000576 [Cordylochernes scorpioides]